MTDSSDTLLKSSASVVNVVGDGNCLFRCVAISSNVSLQRCKRKSNGTPCSKAEEKMEATIANVLRQNVVEFIRSNSIDLKQAEKDLPFLLDKDVGKSYLSLAHRVEEMSNTHEYGGFLELAVLSYLGNVPVKIYSNNVKDQDVCSEDSSYCLVAKFELSDVDNTGSKDCINLLYRMDTKRNPGHFSLIVRDDNRQCQSFTITESNKMTTFREFLLSFVSCNSSKDLPPCKTDNVPVVTSQPSNSWLSGEPPALQTQPGKAKVVENLATSQSQPVSVSSLETGVPEKTLRDKVSSFSDGNDCIGHTHKNGRHYVFCKLCCKQAEAVRAHFHKSRLPAIATEFGTIFRKDIVHDHLASEGHLVALKSARISSLPKVEIAKEAPMDKMISRGNLAAANKIGSLMVTVYNDAKRLTLSANSWPSREIANQKAKKFECNKINDDQTYDMQYVTPNSHFNLLECIVQAHRSDILNKLMKSRALSLRIDGSVDRTQIDKIYVLGKIVLESGECEQVFLGMAEPQERGAVGMVDAIKEALTNTLGTDSNKVLKLASSLVTDGASVNTGGRNGLWTLLQNDISSNATAGETVQPLMKIWCAVHRSQLAWQSVSASVVEIKHCFQNLVSLVTYFHTSGVRTRELKQMAKEKKMALNRLPKVFEIRWTEFSYSLVNSVLVSWSALVAYLSQSNDKAAKGHLNFLTSHANLQLLSFLADVLMVFAKFQKRMQSDSTTLFDMHNAVTSVTANISALKQKPLAGGWQETLLEHLHEKDGDIFLNTTKLWIFERRRKEHHLFVTDKRDDKAICNEVVESMIEFLQQRFSIDQVLLSALIPFLKFDTKNVNLRAVHNAICNDLDLAELSIEFHELSDNKDISTSKLCQVVKRLASANDAYPNMLTVCSRILAAKPHSADVERCISSNNLLKTALRASLHISTENLYLFIHHNMPPTTEWDPRPAVLKWLQTPRRQTVPQKAKAQPYYKNVFREADGCPDEDDNEENSFESTDDDENVAPAITNRKSVSKKRQF